MNSAARLGSVIVKTQDLATTKARSCSSSFARDGKSEEEGKREREGVKEKEA